MDIAFKENKNQISFILSNLDEKLIPVFKDQFYNIEDNKVIKTFPKPIENIEQIKNRTYIKQA